MAVPCADLARGSIAVNLEAARPWAGVQAFFRDKRSMEEAETLTNHHVDIKEELLLEGIPSLADILLARQFCLK
jgi:hypothetical protein